MCCKPKRIRNNFSVIVASETFQTVENDKIVAMTFQNLGTNTVSLYGAGLQGRTLVTNAILEFPVIPGDCPNYYALNIPLIFGAAGTSSLGVTKYYLEDFENAICSKCSQ